MGYRTISTLPLKSADMSFCETISYEDVALCKNPEVECSDFTLQQELGRGGTGVVYLAYQDYPAREVAIKQSHGLGENQQNLVRLRLLQSYLMTCI